MLRAAFKMLLLLTSLVLGLLLLFGLVLWIGWPWWVGIFVLIGLTGVALGAAVGRKIWARRREQMFVHQVIAQDESMYRKMASKDQDAAKQLRDRWMEAIDALRKSHLRKAGNPLYVLPWYMVIGESGSGKTTAIQSARLTSPFAEMNRTSGISGTRNCDWWFFEQAVIIDTAGRYAMPVDESRDQQEWQEFLTLLAKYRKKEPLNGLVVTVAADRLSQSSPDSLQEEGRTIRKRMEELTRVLGAKSPVYVMITKCDLVQGATQFCNQLPEAALNQAMGFLNRNLSGDGAGIIDKAVQTVGDRLRDLRLLLLHRTKNRDAAAGMLLFPEEIGNLKNGLSAFVKGAFQENPYQETPLLRGVFFSSGRQEGTPFSHFLNALGLIQARDVLPGTSKGLFLHDFFAKILPADRQLFKPTQHIVEWRRLTRNLGLTAWIALVLAGCGLLSYAFLKNLNAMSDARKEFQTPVVLQGNPPEDIVTLERFRQAVLKVEDKNRNWWIPRLWLNESLKVEKGLKQKYADLFQGGFLQRYDTAFGDRLKTFGPDTPKGAFGPYVGHLLRRITVLKARLDQQGLAKLRDLPPPDYNPSLVGGSDLGPEMHKMLSTEYIYAVAWEQENRRLNIELTTLQARLKQVLTIPGVTLNWLTDWVEADPSLAPITLADFWGGPPVGSPPVVPAAYTREGKIKIDAAMAEIEGALDDPTMISAAKVDFGQWYTQNYFHAWKDFVLAFEKGTDLLKEKPEWQTVARTLPTDKGPYNALIQRIALEFQSFDQDTAIPSWAAQAYRWQEVRRELQNTPIADLENAGLFRKAAGKVTTNIKKAERALGIKVRTPMDPEAQRNAAKTLNAYQTSLSAISKGADSRNLSFEMASALYQQDPAVGDSPFFMIQRAVNELKLIMGDQDGSDSLFWELVQGNLRFMHHYLLRETACQIQALWEKGVLLEYQDVRADKDLAQLMMGTEGFVTKFVRGPAGPFVGRSVSKGYFAKQMLDLELPLHKDFLTFLGKGAQAAARPVRSNYMVKVVAFPTGTNPEAQVRPHSTVLEMQCIDGSTRLENFNFPVNKIFTWSPQNCGDVTFQIAVGELLLTYRYAGPNAFAEFLNDFKSGERIFRRSEFPADEATLRRMGISLLRAKYRFEGQFRDAMEVLGSIPGAPPRKIVTCWE